MILFFDNAVTLLHLQKKKKTTVNGLFKAVFMIKYEMHIQQIFLNEVRDTNLTTMILTMINHATLF